MYFSNYLENALINATLRNISFTPPSTIYLALFTSNPTETGTGGTEVSTSETGYARQAVTFVAPNDGITTNSADVSFAISTGNYGTVTHIGLFDALTGGNMLYYCPLSVSKTVSVGDQFKVLAGSLQVQLS